MPQKIAPYGSWKSPITSDLIVSATIGFGQIVLDGQDTYWIETRPQEGGRHVIVKHGVDGRRHDITPANLNARTRVHEYGGGAYTVAGGKVYFSNFSDQHLYLQAGNAGPELVDDTNGMRYADGVVAPDGKRLICVREDHSIAGREAANAIVSLPLDGSGLPHVLASGNDFYASPRVSPDGKQLAWLTWKHPNMPWDGCELWLGELQADGGIAGSRRITGSDEESVFQPEWSPEGVLHFVSDRTGWWNLYRSAEGEIEPLCQMQAEFGRAQWIFGYSCYAFESAGKIVCTYTKDGIWHLGLLDTARKKLDTVGTGYTDIMWLKAAPGRAVFRGGSPTSAASIVQLDLKTMACGILRQSSELSIDDGFISIAETIEFPTENNCTAHAFFYRPRNKDYKALAGELPPLLVLSHGGPTGETSSMLDLEIQYWTSRGIAVLDVNYGGSTGYGRQYRQRLDRMWGVVDVDDCVNGALYAAGLGLADRQRLMIAGGSAGGYTTLCALTFRDVFKCGASHYGIGDLEAMAKDTHKFESRYLDRLIGPYPDRQDLYLERSPIKHVDLLSCPVIFFQGLEDKVVPPNQAEMMVEALRKKKIPVAYIAFPGEQHGFRRAETIKRALDGELYFYSRIFKFDLAEPVEPVAIENLDGRAPAKTGRLDS